jgi:hypothetical protein
MKEDLTVQEALTFLKSKGYRLNKALQYDEDVLYLVKRKKKSGRESYSTRRGKDPTYSYKTQFEEIGCAKLILSELNWETFGNKMIEEK